MHADFELLDTLVPLRGASYGDAVAAGVDIPLRYAEFFVRLANGARARLADPWQLLGFDRAQARYGFRAGSQVLLVEHRPGEPPRCQRWSPRGACRAACRRDPAVGRLGDCLMLTATDGGLLFIARAEPASVTRTSRARSRYPQPGLRTGEPSIQRLGR